MSGGTKEVIDFNELPIRSLEDYDKLFELINKNVIDEQTVYTLSLIHI